MVFGAGWVPIRVIDAQIALTLSGGGRRIGHYRLITTLLDPHRYPATEIVKLYHQRWEIETAYLELKSTTLGGRVLRLAPPKAPTRRSTLCWPSTRHYGWR